MGKGGESPEARPKLAVIYTPQQRARFEAMRGMNWISTDPTSFMRLLFDRWVEEQVAKNGMSLVELDELARRLEAGGDSGVAAPDERRRK